jgi:hypothetical protein
MWMGQPHGRVVSAGLLLVASNRIFEPVISPVFPRVKQVLLSRVSGRVFLI